MFASSALWRMGVLSLICRHASGVGSSRLPSGPMLVAICVTSSSRMPSSGGLGTLRARCLVDAWLGRARRLHGGGTPLAVRMLGREGVLELAVVDDAPLRRVHEEDAARVEALLD